MLEKYRPTMTDDIVHSWASEAQSRLDALEEVVSELTKELEATYSLSPEGREYLKKMNEALNL